MNELEVAPVLVYGTHGTPHETLALLALARFDQQLAWYRTRGTPTIYTDVEYEALLSSSASWRLQEVPFSSHGRMRAVVLYGNADSNSAWKRGVGELGSIDARANTLHIGERSFEGDDAFGWFFPPSSGRRVLAVTATGVRGARAGALVRCLTEPLDGEQHAFWRIDSNSARGRSALAQR